MAEGNVLSSTIIPGNVGQIIGGTENQLAAATGGLPTMLQLGENVPGLTVPNLDPQTMAILAQLETQGTTSPELQAAQAQIGQLTGGPIGSSPTTQAALKSFQDMIAPTIKSASAAQGTSGGGQALEALALGGEQAMVPFLQQEVANREAAVGQESNLNTQRMNSLANALMASGMPRDVALQQAKALFEQQQQKWQYASGVQNYPLQWIPDTFSQKGKTWSTMTGEDIASGVGSFLSSL